MKFPLGVTQSKMSNGISEFKETLDGAAWVKKNWERPTTLALILAIATWGLFSIFYEIDLGKAWGNISVLEFLTLIGILGAISAIWGNSRKLPKISRGKIGIVIAINCETKKERQRLRSEFIDGFKSDISRGNHQDFEVLSLSDYRSEKIDSVEKAAKAQETINAQLFIWGRCRIRGHQAKSTYVLDLQERLSHIPIPQNISQKLSQEMGRTFPRKTLIPESEELTGFQLTRELIGVGVRYSLGLASHISMNPILALDFHEGLWNEIKAFPLDATDIPSPFQYLRRRLPNLLIEEANQANFIYLWNRPSQFLENMKKCLDLLETLEPRNYHAHLIRAAYYFLSSKNILKAKREIRRAKNERDSAWEFSQAFLEAYEGDLEKSHRTYQSAFRGIYQDHIPNQTEEFIRRELEEEPAKIQFHYCLGMINYFCKEDLISAKSDFQNFVREAESQRVFPTSIGFAKHYIEKIGKKKTAE